MLVKILLAGVVTCAAAIPAPGFAALGDKVDSVQTDKTRMRAAGAPVRNQSSYAIHEYQTPAGTTVREYAAADGTIFAVAWQGPSLPDINHLLGKYFDQYKEAKRNTRNSRRHASVRQTDLVVQSDGHIGAFAGKAYLPQFLPQGVSPDELQ